LVFSHDFVGEHLLQHATGAVFLRVPKRILHELPIPIPKGVPETSPTKEIVIKKTDDAFSTQLAAFYDDYVFNVQDERFHTAVILAGAMAEMVI